MPFPNPEITPPVTNINLVLEFLVGILHINTDLGIDQLKYKFQDNWPLFLLEICLLS